MSLKSFGTMGVDWEERVNFERLRNERLGRIKKMLKASDLGALLCFDMNNIRYLTATIIGTWALDKLVRYARLLSQLRRSLNTETGQVSVAMTAAHDNPVPTRSSPTVPLAQLASGQRCRVAAMNVNPAEAQLLEAMGLTNHCELCVCRPGEPCIIRINCTRLGLAGTLARRILVHQLFPQT